MYIAIAIAAALLGADRVLKYLSRTGKLRLESKYLRLTHLENRGFFLGLGQKHEKLLRWLPMGVWLLAAVCLLPELGKRVFSAQLGILLVLLGGLILVISFIQSFFPPERTRKILGRFHGIGANCAAALLGAVGGHPRYLAAVHQCSVGKNLAHRQHALSAESGYDNFFFHCR